MRVACPSEGSYAEEHNPRGFILRSPCQTRLTANQEAVGEKWLQGLGLDTREAKWEYRSGNIDRELSTRVWGCSSFE